jgi:hypothetical protein
MKKIVAVRIGYDQAAEFQIWCIICKRKLKGMNQNIWNMNNKIETDTKRNQKYMN